MVIYFVRHQAAGVVWEYPFLQLPSKDQVSAVAEICTRRHGAEHPKLKRPYGVTIVEVDALSEGEELLVPPLEPTAPDARIGMKPIEMSGTGHVRNPGA